MPSLTYNAWHEHVKKFLTLPCKNCGMLANNQSTMIWNRCIALLYCSILLSYYMTRQAALCCNCISSLGFRRQLFRCHPVSIMLSGIHHKNFWNLTNPFPSKAYCLYRIRKASFSCIHFGTCQSLHQKQITQHSDIKIVPLFSHSKCTFPRSSYHHKFL